MGSSDYERDVMPYFAGLVSFFRLPEIGFDDITEGMAVVAGVPIDNGIYGGRVGARFGPRAIRESSLFSRSGYELAPDTLRIDLDTDVGTKLKENLKMGDLGDFNIYPNDLMKTTESVIHGMSEVSKRGGFPAVMGGDHYVAYPSFEGYAKGFAERKENAKLGFIHIDAHTDFWDSHALGGKYHHGTMVRRISENPMVDYKNLAWVGLNSPVTLDQYELKRNHNLKMTTAQNVRDKGITQIMAEAMETASDGVDAVYVSIDIDVIDAHESTGTGSPEFHGVTTNEFFEAMDMLAGFDMLGAFDLCEVSPEWDPSGQTVRIATSGMLKILAPWLIDTVNPDDLLT